MAGAQGPLKLLAEDGDDLATLSAALQDAVIKIGDIQYEADARRLTLAANRYRWEDGRSRRERVRTGVQFGGVLAVKTRNLRRDAPNAVVELLSIAFEPGEAPGGIVALTFAGGGDLRLEVECVDVILSDLSQAWPARGLPEHG